MGGAPFSALKTAARERSRTRPCGYGTPADLRTPRAPPPRARHTTGSSGGGVAVQKCVGRTSSRRSENGPDTSAQPRPPRKTPYLCGARSKHAQFSGRSRLHRGRLSSRLLHHRKERVRFSLEQLKNHHLSLTWRLPTALNMSSPWGSSPDGYWFEAAGFSRVWHGNGGRSSPRECHHRDERHEQALEPVGQQRRRIRARVAAG